jgi:hypothetical protein
MAAVRNFEIIPETNMTYSVTDMHRNGQLNRVIINLQFLFFQQHCMKDFKEIRPHKLFPERSVTIKCY